MEPIINQEQFLPIIQQEPRRGKKKESCLALKLSVGDEAKKRKAERVKYYMKNRHEKALGKQDKAEKGEMEREMREWREAVKLFGTAKGESYSNNRYERGGS